MEIRKAFRTRCWKQWPLDFLFLPRSMVEFLKRLRTIAPGYLVAERDHRALAEQLLELVQSGDRLSELAQRGAESVAEKFNDKKQVRLLEDFYFEAMNERA